MQNEEKYEKPKHQDKIVALDNLSLGISIVAAILIGFGIGYGLKHLTGYTWTLWLGIIWGILAAGLNIYKAYKRAQKEFEGLENDTRYAHRAKYGDKSFDDED
ncbi:AtpZ/AtpI family protein [Aliarcobacter butzleri]|uniref:AtpZ/AtpI family protein n=1 Tax=Aliarcobacter butzleri TaxID=28197 RepID=UPI00214C4A89|nr:AtpZ/AtpI family protein [Aliarcobacter butzleri]MCP3649064.1 AtpZ/AtpI family protein [Arcobacter sp. DNRA7]MCR1815238.1 AtpZ/AtpI family protein [Aliarcobacter butzleri]